MPFQLVIVQGRAATRAVKLPTDAPASMGRQQGCQVRINSSLVSRKHCEVFEKKGLLLVKDLGSSNGTFVNGKRIADQQVLEIGDELSVGPIRFRIEKFEGVAVAAAAAGVPIAEPATEKDPEEFEITFDEEPDADDQTRMLTPAPQKPAPEPVAAVAAPAPAAPRPVDDDPDAPIPVGEMMGEDQVADFLLGIELDEEDKT